MDDRDRFPPARGDEAQLFREYNDELLRTVAKAVGPSTPQLIEDACSFAWAKFLQCQPDRNENWKGWLFRTAQREAWRLSARSRETRSLGSYAGEEDRVLEASTRGRPDPYETQLDVNEAFEILEHLPERLRRIALLRALGMRHKDISELTGDSPTRVGQLIARANMHIYDFLSARAEEQQLLPARAQQLAALERRPPAWLTERIGRPPRVGKRKVSQATTRRAWRRAALALDAYRAAGGFEPNAVDRELREPELRQLRVQADQSVDELNRERARQMRRSCGR